jgi:hypothetical protein
MPTEPQPITVFEVVRRAVEVCDDGTSPGLDDLLLRFEDDDELEVPLTMARAVVTYLAYRRDELDEGPVELLRLAARAEFDGHPPEHVAQWLAMQGVTGA